MIHPILVLILTFIPAIYLAIKHSNFFICLLKDIRLGRIIHYYILSIFGFILVNSNFHALETVSFNQWIHIIIYFFILSYAAVFAIAANNQEDLEIDKISNVNRPLVQETVNPILYIKIARFSLLFALLFATLTNFIFLFAILGISIVYYLYSCKPFKFKRYVLFAKFLIGINSLISAVCGYTLAGGRLSEFPIFWLLFILIPVSLMANFVDLKDTEGDRAAGIKTLPVLLGDDTAKVLIAGFCLLMYTMVVIYFRNWTINSLVITMGIIHILLIFKKPYKEKYLFLLHNFSFIGLIFLILIQNHFEL